MPGPRSAYSCSSRTEGPLPDNLTALLARPAEAAKLQLEQHDLIADRLLERLLRGVIPPDRLEALLTARQNSAAHTRGRRAPH
jgi:hypothetical protein